MLDIRCGQADLSQPQSERARDIGFEWLELHFAHGYLAHHRTCPKNGPAYG
ncbi:MAG: hypothetical protein HXX11_10025 [Desulfuromonadales bacterium]|nr:hypothetical protein [Desulfuromonadales bacterium]